MIRMLSVFTVMMMSLVSVVSAAPQEVKPVESLPCFPGAYYRKAVSSYDVWTGIEAVVKLPELDYDMTRLKSNGQPKDNASVYLGGRANGQEIDCGVSWEVIREADGSVSKMRKAFRPFWRNKKWHSGPTEPKFYYYPGDVIRMHVENTEDGKLLMRIDLLARSGDDGNILKPVNSTRETTPIVATKPAVHLGDKLTTKPVDAISSFTTIFEAPGFKVADLKQFKRVNGMDQTGNEGKPVQVTDTRISHAVWNEVWLLRGSERVPMTPERFTDMRCPDSSHVVVESRGIMGETVTLMGNPKSR